MASTSAEDAVEELILVADVYENQWKWPSGWRDVPQTRRAGGGSVVSAACFHVPPWSCVNGRAAMHPVDMLVPENGTWEGEWEVERRFSPDDRPGCSASDTTDDQGWRYGESMEALLCGSGISASWHPEWLLAARRRRWLRLYRVFRQRAQPVNTAVQSSVKTGITASEVSLSPASVLLSVGVAGPCPQPVALPHSLRGLPMRRSSDMLTFGRLAEDVTALISVVQAVRQAAGHIGGPSDSEALRSSVRRLVADTALRLECVDACARANARRAVDAARVAAADRSREAQQPFPAAAHSRSSSSPPRESAFDAATSPPIPPASLRSSSSGDSVASFAAVHEPATSVGRSTEAATTALPASHVAAAASAAAAERRRWDKLSTDLRAAAGMLAGEADRFAARCDASPLVVMTQAPTTSVASTVSAVTREGGSTAAGGPDVRVSALASHASSPTLTHSLSTRSASSSFSAASAASSTASRGARSSVASLASLASAASGGAGSAAASTVYSAVAGAQRMPGPYTRSVMAASGAGSATAKLLDGIATSRGDAAAVSHASAAAAAAAVRSVAQSGREQPKLHQPQPLPSPVASAMSTPERPSAAADSVSAGSGDAAAAKPLISRARSIDTPQLKQTRAAPHPNAHPQLLSQPQLTKAASAPEIAAPALLAMDSGPKLMKASSAPELAVTSAAAAAAAALDVIPAAPPATERPSRAPAAAIAGAGASSRSSAAASAQSTAATSRTVPSAAAAAAAPAPAPAAAAASDEAAAASNASMALAMAQVTAPLPAIDVDFTEALVEERSRRIESITGEVLEVAGVFADIRALVAGHGEALEAVETRVDDAAARMREGVKHVREAERIENEGAGCIIM